MEKHASACKINRAADDASGLAISEKLRNQITSNDTYYDNGEDGANLIQIADGAMEEIGKMIRRGVEISMRAANGILDDVDREIIQDEVDEILDEIDRIADTKKYNNIELLRGDAIKGDTDQGGAVIKGDMPDWVGVDQYTQSAGTLSTLYTTKNGDICSGVEIDFSNFTPSDIKNSVGKGFTMTCCMCTDHYSIRFTDDPNDEKEKQSGNHWIYNIDISNAKTPDDVYNEVLKTSKPQHGIVAEKDNGKLIFYDQRKWSTPFKEKGFGIFSPGVAYSPDDPEVNNRGGVDKVKINVGDSFIGDITIDLPDVSTEKLGIYSVSVETVDDAMAAKDAFNNASIILSSQRGILGAQQNRLGYAINTASSTSENLSEAKSRIMDTDMAKESTELAKFSILNQSSQAMLA